MQPTEPPERIEYVRLDGTSTWLEILAITDAWISAYAYSDTSCFEWNSLALCRLEDGSFLVCGHSHDDAGESSLFALDDEDAYDEALHLFWDLIDPPETLLMDKDWF